MKDVLIGIDAGTSVIKSVAFSLSGKQLAEFSIANEYNILPGGGAEQDMQQTWQTTVATLKGLLEANAELGSRVAAVAITGQGDGTWLIDKAGEPVMPAWLWLDARAGNLVSEFRASDRDASRFNLTGTGFAACQQGAQIMWMQRHAPELLASSETACHCKDWLYYKLTGERVTDPSEGGFTFGDFRTGEYSSTVTELLDINRHQHLLPPMLDGISQHMPLSEAAASQTGLLAGTPVVLGYVDVICTALGAGLYDSNATPGCTIVGSTGIHMRLVRSVDDIVLSPDCTGFTMPMPIAGVYAQMQSNMSSTLNIDWLLDVAVDLLNQHGLELQRKDLLNRIDQWLDQSESGDLLYQPYISEAGERGPFIDSTARAGFVGLNTQHRFADMLRSVIEGLAFAARDCYGSMGTIPAEIRLTGGAARSHALRRVFGDVLGTELRTSSREEAGAAGAAMMAAVAIGHYASMDECVDEWVAPLLSDLENFDQAAHHGHNARFPNYVAARKALAPVWHNLADSKDKS